MKTGNVEKLPTNLHDKTEYGIHIRNLTQALNHRLVLKKVCRETKFIGNASLKPYIDMNTKLRQKGKKKIEKDFFRQTENAVFGKTVENLRKYRNIKLLTTERRKNYLVSQPNYHTTKLITENL